MDYTFGVAGNNKLFFRLNMREGTYIPASITGSSELTWQRKNFKDPKEFQQLEEAENGKQLKVFATPTRAVLEDGTIVGE